MQKGQIKIIKIKNTSDAHKRMSQATTADARSQNEGSLISKHIKLPESVKNSLEHSQEQWEKLDDPFHKIEVAFNFLSKLESDPFIKTSQKIMPHLQQIFQIKVDQAYLPWLKFFDMSVVQKPKFQKNEGLLFQQGIEELVTTTIHKDYQKGGVDWRIIRKIQTVPNIFPKDGSKLLTEEAKKGMLSTFKREIEMALSQMVWIDPKNQTMLQTYPGPNRPFKR